MTSHFRQFAGRAATLVLLLGSICAGEEKNLLTDPSFEITKDRDQFGLVFAKWSGWKYEGDCDFRVGDVAHGGKHSCLLAGRSAPKIRIRQVVDLDPGRYRVTAFVRGLDIGAGTWNASTEFMFDEKYMQIEKRGTFGWTRLTYVADITSKKRAGPSFGLMAPGYFWIDDVSLERVGDDVAVTPKPVLEREESAIAPPGEIRGQGVRCSECGYRNMPEWKTCYACGTALESKASVVAAGPATRPIAAPDGGSGFEGGVVEDNANAGPRSIRIDKGYISMSRPQNWTGYDFLKADLYTDSTEPLPLYLEIRDTSTRDYWTRVNYQTLVPPGKSTLIIPIRQLYVGEKARPGRMLDLAGINAVALSVGDKPPAPLYLRNLRLERDDSQAKAMFDGLFAFDFGTGTSPVMEGFTQITPATQYSKGRGYGLKNAKIWNAFDALQPDPLYQDFICIESGGLAVDLPNGKYHIFVNLDNPSGFWGEYQAYRKRVILAQGQPVVTDTLDFDAFRKKYFRFWNVEDLPSDNTFDKYQKTYFHEKSFDVDVTNGQLQLDFQGESWACSVSAVVIYPAAKSAEGERFLQYVQQKRRFYFENYFRRTLHRATGDPLQPSAEDKSRGFVSFQRDVMQDVYYNDTPRKDETGHPIRASAFAGEYAPIPVALVPLADLANVTAAAGDLTGPAGTIPASAIDLGYVSYRLTRVTAEGSIYTISPRIILPGGSVPMPEGLTRQFWPTIHTPTDAKPGLYKGSLSVTTKLGRSAIPVAFRVREGPLDPVDIPAGPFGYNISVPWPNEDPQAAQFNRSLTESSLRKMREYGFTTCTGFPSIAYGGFKDGKPVLDFSVADTQMKQAKDLGFLAVVTYGGGVSGIDAYHPDLARMKEAGFQDYSDFVKSVYTAVQQHADSTGWIPVYYNVCDEPVGDDVVAAAQNAAAYRKAFPKGPPFFTGASSYKGNDAHNPHFMLGRSLSVVSWNDHDEDSVKLLRESGGDWGFYNGGNRWTYGSYMYKAAKQFGMKFRIAWHWNAAAGDPYYALDCREDDYAWCSAGPDCQLIPSLEFERNREGLGDYRRLLTLARLCREHPGTPAAATGEDIIRKRMGSFRLDQRDHDALFPQTDWNQFRSTMDDAIKALRK